MRELTSHKVSGLNDALAISAMDDLGSGGAHHCYMIECRRPDGMIEKDAAGGGLTHIHFQNGPISEAGVNGISNEALLAIVEDRLKCFQDGPYKCRENAIALTHIQDAMHWLHHRTRERLARGVEGTSEK